MVHWFTGFRWTLYLSEQKLGKPDLGEQKLGEPDLGEQKLGEPDLGELF